MKIKYVSSFVCTFLLSFLLFNPLFAQDKNYSVSAEVPANNAEMLNILQELAIADKIDRQKNILALAKNGEIEEIKKMKVSEEDQYDVMSYCIENNDLTALENLLLADFIPTLTRKSDNSLEETSLLTKAIINRNIDALNLIYNNIDKTCSISVDDRTFALYNNKHHEIREHVASFFVCRYELTLISSAINLFVYHSFEDFKLFYDFLKEKKFIFKETKSFPITPSFLFLNTLYYNGSPIDFNNFYRDISKIMEISGQEKAAILEIAILLYPNKSDFLEDILKITNPNDITDYFYSGFLFKMREDDMYALTENIVKKIGNTDKIKNVGGYSALLYENLTFLGAWIANLCKSNNTELLELLLDSGADLNKKIIMQGRTITIRELANINNCSQEVMSVIRSYDAAKSNSSRR